MPKQYLPYALWNYTPVLKALPAPGIDQFDQAPTVCLVMSEKLIPYLLGLLEIYRWKDKLTGTPDEIDQGIGVFADLVAVLADGGNCPAVIKDIRVNNCNLEITYDGVTWVNAGSLSECAIEGPPGPPGADGQGIDQVTVNTLECDQVATAALNGGLLTLGIPRGCNGADALPPLVPPETIDPAPVGSDNEICGGVLAMTEYLFDYANYWLDVREAESAGASVALRLVGLFPFLAPLQEAIANLALAITDYGLALLRVQVNDPDFQNQYRCGIYSLVYPEGRYSESLHDVFADSTIPIPLPDQQSFMDYLLYTLGYARANTMYLVGTTNPSDVCEALCAPSYDWVRDYDFTQGAVPGFVKHSGNQWTVLGLQGGLPYFQGSNIENLYWFPGSNCVVQEVKIYTTNYTPDTGTTVGYIKVPDYVTVADINAMNESFVGGVITWQGVAPIESDERAVFLLRDTVTEPPATRIYITRMIISGTGTPPTA